MDLGKSDIVNKLPCFFRLRAGESRLSHGRLSLRESRIFRGAKGDNYFRAGPCFNEGRRSCGIADESSATPFLLAIFPSTLLSSQMKQTADHTENVDSLAN
jgi:hypothetical protein